MAKASKFCRRMGVPLVIAALIPAQSHAKSWPEAGGWTIAEGDDSCGMHDSFEGKGDTELTVVLNLDGSVGVLITNTGWSAVEGEKYEMSWVLDRQQYDGTNIGFGGRYAYRKGFVAKFAASFLEDFARGSSLRILRGEILVDHLSLDGSAAAVAMARRCVAHLQSIKTAAEKERQRLAHIVDDPFAGDKVTAAIAQSGELQPKGMPGRWATNDDYPALAMREEREGKVGFALQVDPAGRIEKCTITSSSGHADLDNETCVLLQRRARFHPSKSGGTYSNVITWSIPR